MLKIQSTSDITTSGAHKVLLYSHHGWGKTYQCRHYADRYGNGLIISGESGLKSIEDRDINYVSFNSWDGPNDEEAGTYSFRTIVKELSQPGYLKDNDINWIAIDSLTELSDRLMEHLEAEYKNSNNSFGMWGDNSRLMIGALKWVRDLPVHVYVSCLAKEEKDANDMTHYWPLVKGSTVSKQVPAIFDHVLCGVRTTEPDESNVMKPTRYIVTSEVSGWHGKVRDPRNTLKSFEKTGNVTELLDRMAAGEAKEKSE